MSPHLGGDPEGWSRARRWVVLAPLCVTLLLVTLDNTILNVALPSIVRDLHASSSQLQWMVDAYATVFAGMLLLLGALGDRVGRKRVFLAGLVVFAGGSAASAWAGTPDRLVLARAVMGVGAAAIMPSTLSILANVFTDEHDRARAVGIWSGTTGLGVAGGPLAGGWLLAHFWWGSVFLVNVPLAAAGLLVAALLVPDSRNPSARRPDPVGAAGSLVGLGLLLWGIIEAPSRGWASWPVLGALSGAAVVLAGFVLWERRSEHPMLPLVFFRARRFTVAAGAMAGVLCGLMGAFFVLTQWLQFALGYSAWQAGLRVAPIAAVVLVMAPLSTLVARRVGSRFVVGGGLAAVSGGLGWLSTLGPSAGYRQAVPAFVLLGLGAGLALAPSVESVLGSLPPAEAGVGSATMDTSLQVGGALGVGVLGSVLSLHYQAQLAPLLAGRAIPGAVRTLILSSLGGAQAVAGAVGGGDGRLLAAAARTAFVHGMDQALLVGAIVVATAAVAVLLLLPRPAPPEPPAAAPSGGTKAPGEPVRPGAP